MTSQKLRPLLLLITVAVFLPLAAFAQFGDPRGFFQNEQISETVLHPGIVYYEANGSHGGRPMVTHVVSIDLETPGLKLQSLTGDRFVNASTDQFYRRSTVSQMQSDNDAVVAINTAFFDIGNPGTMAPRGLHVRDGMMVREAAANRPSLAITEGAVPFLADLTSSQSVRYGGNTASLQGINVTAMGNSSIAAFVDPWDRSPGSDAPMISGRAITEVVIDKIELEEAARWNESHVLRGRVVQVRDEGPSASLNENRFVLTATGNARSFLQQMEVDEIVEIEWQLSGQPANVGWHTIKEVSSGWHSLIRNGNLQDVSGTSHRDSRHPRTAAGIGANESKVLFVLVEGRQSGRAEGMSLTSLRNYMDHLGARHALEFDGGGSSAMAGRINGSNQLFSVPSDGSERFVPAGLGVIAEEEEENPFFENIRITGGGDGAVVSWETPEPAVSYALYGRSGYDQESARNLEASTSHSVLLSNLGGERHFVRLVAETSAETHTSHGLEVGTSEVIVNDTEASFSGNWSTGSFGTPYGSGYRWTDTVSGTPTHTATFQPDLPASGRYDIDVWYVPGGNRTTDARHLITHAEGTSGASISQRTGGNGWEPLASNVLFEAGSEGSVQVRNDSNSGTVVMADAIRWTLREAEAPAPGEVPQWWLQHFFGSDAPSLDTDTDGDGYSLFEEFIWGTAPDNARSSPSVTFEAGASDNQRLIFTPFRKDREYLLEETSDLGGDWTPVDAVPQSANGRGLFEVPVPGDDQTRSFYRIRVMVP